jgi:hypothetical protein
MKKNVWNGIVLLAAVMAVLAGCEQAVEPLSSDATIKSVTVNGVKAEQLGTPSTEWNLAEPGYLLLTSDQLEAAKVSVSTSEGAKVYFARSTLDQIPDFVTGKTFDFDYGDYLYIRVFSANHDAENIYRIEIDVSDDTAALTSLTVGGKTVTLEDPDLDPAEAAPSSVWLTKTQLESTTVVAVQNDTALKLRYGKAPVGVIPTFAENPPTSFNAEDVLFVGVSRSARSNSYLYYTVAVHNTTPEIRDITLGGRSASGGQQLNGIPIQAFGTGLGIPGATWNDAAITAGEAWFGTSQASTSLALAVSPVATATNWEVAVVANGTTQPTGFASSPSITVADGHYLYIKATNTFPGGSEDAFYKVKLTAKNDSRAIGNITIGGKTVTAGPMGTHSFPGSEAWGNYSSGAELAPNNGSIAGGVGPAGLSNLAVVIGSPPVGATIGYGYTTTERDYNVDFSNTTGTLGSVPNGAFIALEVTSALGEKGWYKFLVYEKDVDSSLQSLTLGGNPISPMPQPDITGASVQSSLSSLGALVATATSGSATVKYGRGPLVNDAPTGGWLDDGNTLVNITADEGAVVYVRVTAEETSFISTYSVALYTSAGIKADELTIGGSVDAKGNVTMNGRKMTTLGTPASTTGTATPGSATINDVAAAGSLGTVYVSAAVGTGLGYRIAKTAGADPAGGDWRQPINGSIGLTAPISNTEVIWIEVSGGSVTNYYKVPITVRAVSALDVEISSLDIGGTVDFKGNFTPGIDVSNLGTPAATAGAATPGAVTLTSIIAVGAAPYGGGAPTVSATPVLAEPTASYMISKTTGAEPTEWFAPTDSGYGMVAPTFTAPIVTGEVLWFKVTFQAFTNIYKIVVTVQ